MNGIRGAASGPGRSSASRRRETAPGRDDSSKLVLDYLMLQVDSRVPFHSIKNGTTRVKIQQNAPLVGPGRLAVQSTSAISTNQNAAPYCKLEVDSFVSSDKGRGSEGGSLAQGSGSGSSHVQQCMALSFDAQSSTSAESSKNGSFYENEEWELLLSTLFQRDCYGSCTLSTSLSGGGSSSTATSDNSPPISGRLYPTGKTTALLVLDVVISAGAVIGAITGGMSASSSHSSLAVGSAEKDPERGGEEQREQKEGQKEGGQKEQKEKERRAGRKDRQAQTAGEWLSYRDEGVALGGWE